jgi:hypothetical protein
MGIGLLLIPPPDRIDSMMEMSLMMIMFVSDTLLLNFFDLAK